MSNNNEEGQLFEWHVPVMLSGMYDFRVYAPTAEEARDMVVDGVVTIDYERLELWTGWDYGDVDVSDVYTEDVFPQPTYEQLELPFSD